MCFETRVVSFQAPHPFPLLTLQALDLGLGDIQHLNVGVQSGSEVKGLVVGVQDAQVSLELLASQSDGVHSLELVGPPVIEERFRVWG